MKKATIEKFISADGTVRAASVISTSVVEHARVIHGSYPVVTAALGRALTGAGLLASFIKDTGKIALYFKGDGPLGNLFAEGSSSGAVRGFVSNPQIHLPSKNGKLDVGSAVGRGLLTVATSLIPDETQSYTGSVNLQTGEIGDDIAFYLFKSQQIPSIVALGVFVEADNSVTAAGGTIVQAMPGVTDETLKILENRVKEMKPVSDLIRGGATASDLAFEALEDLSFRKMGEGSELKYSCQCSMQKVERALMLMGASELQILVDKSQASEVCCDFCGQKYNVDLETLQALLSITKKRS